MPVLVVNADDYGLTPGVSEGVLRCHEQGIVTSTSALVVAPGFSSGAPALRSSGLPAGLHLCAVGEDPPLLGPREIPTLVDDAGRFPLTWKGFLRRAVRGQVDPDDLRREFDAQFEALASEGITPTHLDSHQNLHLWPPVTTIVLDLARRRDVHVVRVADARRVRPVTVPVAALAMVARRRVASSGLVAPPTSSGLDHAGAMDVARIRATLDRHRSSPGPVDLTVHPGVDPDPDRSRYAWGYSWADEAAALLDPSLRRWIEDAGFVLGSFADLGAGR